MPGSSVYGIFQAGTLEQVAISFSRGSSWPRNQNYISCVSWIGRWILYYCATCCYSVTKLWLTLCQPMNGSMPGFPALHYLLEFVQIHVHCVGDAIQASHLLSPPSPLAFNLLTAWESFPMSQFFVSGSQSIGASPSAAVFPVNIQGWFSLGLTGLISFRIDWFDLLAVQWNLKSLLQHRKSKHQFFSTEPSLWSNSHICTWLLEKHHSFDYMDLCQQGDVSVF